MQTQQVLHQALGTWFQGKLGSSYQIGTPYAYPQYPYPQPQVQVQYPYQQPQQLQPQIQYPQYVQPLAYQAPKPLGTPLGQGIIPGLIQKDGVFDIPDSARRFMSLRFRQFRELIPKESSPAASRAHTLAALINRDNSVQTGVCRDPYWTEANPNKIYPWATLQLLCVNDWTTLSDDYGRVTFKQQWKDKFLGPLAEIYNGKDLPKLEGSGKVLEQMRFTNVSAIPVCMKRQDPRVGFRDIQNTLVKLQGLYDGHIVHMWRLINSLIFTIVDPVKKTEMVRLHKNSQKHVEAIADEARDRIADFYIQVERVYSETVKKMTEL
jgi:hypothetical protein